MQSRAEVPEPEFEVEHEVPADGTAGCAQPLIASAASAAVAKAGLADGSHSIVISLGLTSALAARLADRASSAGCLQGMRAAAGSSI
jgi:hypothetical protein